MPHPTGPGGKSTDRKPLRGPSTLLPCHMILQSRFFQGKHGTSLPTNFSLAQAQLPKYSITILRNPSRPQVYHGSMATHDLFPEIFGTPDTCTTLLTLVTSLGHPTPHGALPGALSSLDALPLNVEIYRSVPFLPPFYVGHPGPQMHLTLPEPGLSLTFDGAPTTHVYLAFHTTTGYSPLHQAVNHGVHRLSLSPSCTQPIMSRGLPTFTATRWTEPRLAPKHRLSSFWVFSEPSGTIAPHCRTPF